MCIRDRRTGRRTEQQGIGHNGAAQQSGNGLINLNPGLLVHLINNRGRAAQGLVAEKYRRHGLDRAQPVVVNDFLDFRALNACHCLVLLIVVHQDHLFAPCAQQVPA